MLQATCFLGKLTTPLGVMLLGSGLFALLGQPSVAAASVSGRYHATLKPTIMLVHGAFADASSTPYQPVSTTSSSCATTIVAVVPPGRAASPCCAGTSTFQGMPR